MDRRIEKILDSYRDEMVDKLCAFIRIESVAEYSSGGGPADAPFGEGPARALRFMEDLAEEKGFTVKDYDRMACELRFGEDKPDDVGTLGHVDVVPASGDWKYPPFEGEVHDGRIYGRGSVDDKGPVIAVFYAVLALKESGIPLSRGIVQILGGSEEGGSFPCIRNYLEKAERIPSCGIVPDSYFPVCISEKHFADLRFTVKLDDTSCIGGRKIRSIRGGEALNIVPAWAEAVFEDEGGNICGTMRQTGRSAHAAVPEEGENAIAGLLKRLAQEDFGPEGLQSAVRYAAEKICSDTSGEGLGIRVRDITGETTCNTALISYQDGLLEIEANVRLPLCMDEDEMMSEIRKTLYGTGISSEITYSIKGFYTDPEEEPAKTLIDVYRSETGDCSSRPYVSGSGSYARIMKDFVPFGIALQHGPEPFHVENESISAEWLIKAAKIYAEALYRMAR